MKQHYSLMKQTAKKAVEDYIKQDQKRKKREEDALCAQMDAVEVTLSDVEETFGEDSDDE